jgi:ferredoxin-type protein NapF
MAQAIDHSRRKLLLGLRQSTPPPVRPPWTSETSIAEACTHCGACAEACGPGLISLGAGGLPALDFTAGECTFCAACADACPEPVFPDVAERKRAFSHVVAIGSTTAASPCLTHRGVVCQTCRDECPEAAMQAPQPVQRSSTTWGTAGPPMRNANLIAACPADAIEISRRAA